MCRIESMIMLNKLCLLEWELTRVQQFYWVKIKSADFIYSSRLKLVFDSAHVKCDV